MEKDIPQYHPSYTEEENRKLHEHIENASDSELVEWIEELCGLYAQNGQENMETALRQLEEEICRRDKMYQKYQKLLKCEKAWGTYLDRLYEYKDVLEIREKYREYKEGKLLHKNSSFNEFLGRVGKTYPEELIRRSTFRVESKNGIKEPIKPQISYASLEEIPVTERTSKECLEKLGTENLKYILRMLLQCVDCEREENAAYAVLLFGTRKYSYESHKKTPGLFSSPMMAYGTLKEKSMELLELIREYQDEAEEK